MSLNYEPQTVTPAEFESVFELERRQAYPAINAFEARLGMAVDRARLEAAARVLASPVKAKAPNWQHGRVLYAVARGYLSTIPISQAVTILDIGTAKGFSALCLQWALDDSRRVGLVSSVDVMDPMARVRRNTIAECDALRTLPEILAPWPEAGPIRFYRATGREWLTGTPLRVNLASVDGKHTFEEVSWEASLLAMRQEPGDVIFFDDLQIAGVARAVAEMKDRDYDIERLQAIPGVREYAIARKR